MEGMFNSLQVEGSSEPSAQSVPSSQYQCAGIQRPFEHRNSLWEHVEVAEERERTGDFTYEHLSQQVSGFHWRTQPKRLVAPDKSIT